MPDSLDLPGMMDLVERLPPFHKVMEKCMVTLSKPFASAREISTYIESDSALSGKVLSLANSSFYGQASKVLQTERAVVLLGRRSLEEVFFSFYIQGLFASQEREVTELWTASLRSGICAKELTYALQLPSAEGQETPDAGAYLAGLLHDAGRLLVLTHYPEAYRHARELGDREQCPAVQAERQVWGFDHAALSQAMALKWGLPSSVCDAIAWHHEPFKAGQAALLAGLVAVADRLAEADQAGLEIGESFLQSFDPALRALLGLDAERLPALRKVLKVLREKMQVLGSLMGSGTWQLPTGA